MQKSKLTPDPVRDAPDGRGDGQSPGAGAWIPGRATRDTSFTRFPMAMVILCYACAHASAYTGTFWVNQRTIARDLEMSQQAVSRHFRKLVELGYLEKVRNENSKRPYGKKGAVWRVIYDPTQSLKDVEAAAARLHKTEEEEQQTAASTIEEAAKGAKGQQSKQRKKDVNALLKQTASALKDTSRTTPRLSQEERQYNTGVVREYNTQVVPNLHPNNRCKDIKESDCRKLCHGYAHAVAERWGSRFRHDLRQEELAAQLLALGYTVESFAADSERMLDWLVRHNRQPPTSLQYFISRKQSRETA